MPERYEREIEDMLRNTESTGPKLPFRERLHLRRRGQAQRPERLHPRRRRSAFPLTCSTSAWCFLGGIVLGVVAAGVAYTSGGGNALTGALAVLAFLAILLGMITPWRER